MSIAGDLYDGGGSKPFKFDSIGDRIEGAIIALRKPQLTEFGSDRLETWPDGEPKYTVIVTVQTTLQEDGEDDGSRDIYLRSGQHTAFVRALKQAYQSSPGDSDLVGAVLVMKFVASERSNKGNDRKVYTAEITPRSVAGDAWSEGDDDEVGRGDEPPPDDYEDVAR